MNLMPSGKFLMEDFYYAGGVPAVVRALGDLIHRDALTVNGKTMGENTADAPCWNAEVIHSREKPIKEHAGIAVLRGNLAPGGAVVKPSAASPICSSIGDGRWYSPTSKISRRGWMILRWMSTRTR